MTALELQTYLANTAHQREVADLKAAGLNPVLSAGGSGAAVPNVMDGEGSASSSVSAKAVSRAMRSSPLYKALEVSEKAISTLSAAQRLGHTRPILIEESTPGVTRGLTSGLTVDFGAPSLSEPSAATTVAVSLLNALASRRLGYGVRKALEPVVKPVAQFIDNAGRSRLYANANQLIHDADYARSLVRR